MNGSFDCMRGIVLTAPLGSCEAGHYAVRGALAALPARLQGVALFLPHESERSEGSALGARMSPHDYGTTTRPAARHAAHLRPRDPRRTCDGSGLPARCG